MNRFFLKDDNRIDQINNRKIPRVWWSRPYEYKYIIDNLKPSDTVLDVGAGIEHPLKFYIADNCKKCVALDVDANILNVKYDNLETINEDILNYKTNEKYDKIVVVSVLEQSKNHLIEKFENMYNLLKDDGMILITSDYPSLDPLKVLGYAKVSKLIPTSEFQERISEESIYHALYQLNCYTITLKKETMPRKQKIETEYKNNIIEPKKRKTRKRG